MEQWKYWRDKSVADQSNINSILASYKSERVSKVEEIRPGVIEYSFEPAGFTFRTEEDKCKFIFVVAKDTGTIIGWRYNSKPENCAQAL